LQGLADVGGVADQVHTAVADMRNDQVNQLAGQTSGMWSRSPGIHRRARIGRQLARRKNGGWQMTPTTTQR
jgi:hypothetical protein